MSSTNNSNESTGKQPECEAIKIREFFEEVEGVRRDEVLSDWNVRWNRIWKKFQKERPYVIGRIGDTTTPPSSLAPMCSSKAIVVRGLSSSNASASVTKGGTTTTTTVESQPPTPMSSSPPLPSRTPIIPPLVNHPATVGTISYHNLHQTLPPEAFQSISLRERSKSPSPRSGSPASSMTVDGPPAPTANEPSLSSSTVKGSGGRVGVEKLRSCTVGADVEVGGPNNKTLPSIRRSATPPVVKGRPPLHPFSPTPTRVHLDEEEHQYGHRTHISDQERELVGDDDDSPRPVSQPPHLIDQRQYHSHDEPALQQHHYQPPHHSPSYRHHLALLREAEDSLDGGSASSTPKTSALVSPTGNTRNVVVTHDDLFKKFAELESTVLEVCRDQEQQQLSRRSSRMQQQRQHLISTSSQQMNSRITSGGSSGSREPSTQQHQQSILTATQSRAQADAENSIHNHILGSPIPNHPPPYLLDTTAVGDGCAGGDDVNADGPLYYGGEEGEDNSPLGAIEDNTPSASGRAHNINNALISSSSTDDADNVDDCITGNRTTRTTPSVSTSPSSSTPPTPTHEQQVSDTNKGPDDSNGGTPPLRSASSSRAPKSSQRLACPKQETAHSAPQPRSASSSRQFHPKFDSALFNLSLDGLSRATAGILSNTTPQERRASLENNNNANRPQSTDPYAEMLFSLNPLDLSGGGNSDDDDERRNHQHAHHHAVDVGAGRRTSQPTTTLKNGVNRNYGFGSSVRGGGGYNYSGADTDGNGTTTSPTTTAASDGGEYPYHEDLDRLSTSNRHNDEDRDNPHNPGSPSFTSSKQPNTNHNTKTIGGLNGGAGQLQRIRLGMFEAEKQQYIHNTTRAKSSSSNSPHPRRQHIRSTRGHPSLLFDEGEDSHRSISQLTIDGIEKRLSPADLGAPNFMKKLLSQQAHPPPMQQVEQRARSASSVASTSAYTDDSHSTADSTNTKILLQDAILSKLAQAMSNQNSTPVTAVAAFDALRQLSTRRLKKMVTQIVAANGKVSPSSLHVDQGGRVGNFNQLSPLKRMISQSPLHDMLKDMIESGSGVAMINNNSPSTMMTRNSTSPLRSMSRSSPQRKQLENRLHHHPQHRLIATPTSPPFTQPPSTTTTATSSDLPLAKAKAIDDYFGNLRRLSDITDVPAPKGLHHISNMIMPYPKQPTLPRQQNNNSSSPVRIADSSATRAQRAALKALESLQQHRDTSPSRSPLRQEGGTTGTAPTGANTQIQLVRNNNPSSPHIATTTAPKVPRGYTEKLMGLVLVNGRDFGPEAADVNVAPSKALTKAYVQVGATIYNGPGYTADVRPGDIIMGCEIVKFSSTFSSDGRESQHMLPSELLEVSCVGVNTVRTTGDIDNTIGAAVLNILNARRRKEEKFNSGLMDTSDASSSPQISYQFGRLHIHRPLWSNCGGIHGHSQSPSSSSTTAAQHLRVQTPSLENSAVAQACVRYVMESNRSDEHPPQSILEAEYQASESKHRIAVASSLLHHPTISQKLGVQVGQVVCVRGPTATDTSMQQYLAMTIPIVIDDDTRVPDDQELPRQKQHQRKSSSSPPHHRRRIPPQIYLGGRKSRNSSPPTKASAPHLSTTSPKRHMGTPPLRPSVRPSPKKTAVNDFYKPVTNSTSASPASNANSVGGWRSGGGARNNTRVGMLPVDPISIEREPEAICRQQSTASSVLLRTSSSTQQQQYYNNNHHNAPTNFVYHPTTNHQHRGLDFNPNASNTSTILSATSVISDGHGAGGRVRSVGGGGAYPTDNNEGNEDTLYSSSSSCDGDGVELDLPGEKQHDDDYLTPNIRGDRRQQQHQQRLATKTNNSIYYSAPAPQLDSWGRSRRGNDYFSTSSYVHAPSSSTNVTSGTKKQHPTRQYSPDSCDNSRLDRRGSSIEVRDQAADKTSKKRRDAAAALSSSSTYTEIQRQKLRSHSSTNRDRAPPVISHEIERKRTKEYLNKSFDVDASSGEEVEDTPAPASPTFKGVSLPAGGGGDSTASTDHSGGSVRSSSSHATIDLDASDSDADDNNSGMRIGRNEATWRSSPPRGRNLLDTSNYAHRDGSPPRPYPQSPQAPSANPPVRRHMPAFGSSTPRPTSAAALSTPTRRPSPTSKTTVNVQASTGQTTPTAGRPIGAAAAPFPSAANRSSSAPYRVGGRDVSTPQRQQHVPATPFAKSQSLGPEPTSRTPLSRLAAFGKDSGANPIGTSTPTLRRATTPSHSILDQLRADVVASAMQRAEDLGETNRRLLNGPSTGQHHVTNYATTSNNRNRRTTATRAPVVGSRAANSASRRTSTTSPLVSQLQHEHSLASPSMSSQHLQQQQQDPASGCSDSNNSQMDVTVASFPSPPRPKAVSPTEEAAWGVPTTRHFDGTSIVAPTSASANTMHHHQRATATTTISTSPVTSYASPASHIVGDTSYDEEDNSVDQDEDEDDILSPLRKAALWR